MLQRTKSLAHVAEFAKRRVQLVEASIGLVMLLARTPAAAPEIQDDKQNGDGKQGDEGGYHCRREGARRHDCSAPRQAPARIRLLLSSRIEEV